MNRKNGLVVWQLLLFVVIMVGVLAALMGAKRAGNQARKAACGGTLKHLCLSFDMYAKEHGGLFPPLSEGKGAWIYQRSAVIPAYWMSVADGLCPRYLRYRRKLPHFFAFEVPRKIQFHDTNPETGYFYFNWVMTSDAMARTVFELYEKLETSAYTEDLKVPRGKGLGDTEIIPRLRLELAQYLGDGVSCPSDSAVPTLMDVISLGLSEHNHRPPGANVVFLDGHVEFIEYPGKFPVTAALARLMDDHRVVIKPSEFERY